MTVNDELHTRPAKSTLVYVNSLRGIASLLVANSHFWQGNSCFLQGSEMYAYLRSSTFFNFFFKGHVCLFFILSGRVLCETVERSKSLNSIASSALRKPIRLLATVFGAAMLDKQLVHWDYLNLVSFHSVRSLECPSDDQAWYF